MATTPSTTGAVRAKEFHFPVLVEWIGGRKTLARVDGKPSVEIAPPPEFRGTDPDVWSPEDFFVQPLRPALRSPSQAWHSETG